MKGVSGKRLCKVLEDQGGHRVWDCGWVRGAARVMRIVRPEGLSRSGRWSSRRPIRQELDAWGPLDSAPPGWRDASAIAKLQPGQVGWR